jgi:hypothetical protein
MLRASTGGFAVSDVPRIGGTQDGAHGSRTADADQKAHSCCPGLATSAILRRLLFDRLRIRPVCA